MNGKSRQKSYRNYAKLRDRIHYRVPDYHVEP